MGHLMALGEFMGKQGLSEASQGRLLALMRPGEGVESSVMVQGLLNAISDESDPVATLAFVFQEKWWACWSGPKTPASAFPEPFDKTPEGLKNTEAEYEEFIRDGKVDRRLVALVAQVQAEEPEPIERAKRAWAFLETVKESRVGRNMVFQVMLENTAFVSPVTPFRGEPPHDEVLPDAKYDAILWRNRAIFARLNGIAVSAAFKTTTGRTAAMLAALAEIPNELERAAVYGAFLAIQRKRDADPRAILRRKIAAVTAVLEAAKRGEPCPSCGEVHEIDEGQHEEHEDK